MDPDPELDVTLSDGRQVAVFQIAARAGGDAWSVVEPRAPLRVIRRCAAWPGRRRPQRSARPYARRVARRGTRASPLQRPVRSRIDVRPTARRQVTAGMPPILAPGGTS